MAHIHTEPYQHDFTASAYIIRLDGDEPRIMFHRHLILKALMQFGGHVELDEHPWQTVAREVREEAGYDLGQLQVLQPSDRPIHFTGAILLPQPLYIVDVVFGNAAPQHYHDDIAWAFITHELPGHNPDEGESQDFALMTRSEIMGDAGKEILGNVRDAASFVFDTCLPNWQSIPAVPLTRPME
jgi:8-oxo-dGTP diphosphatase